MSITKLLMSAGGATPSKAPSPYWLSKIDGGTSGVVLRSVVTTSDGYIYASGKYDSRGAILKYDQFGNVLWKKYAPGTNVSDLWGVATDSSGNAYVITGDMIGSPITNAVYFVKFDPSGNVVWQKYLESTVGQDVGRAIAIASNGDIYLTGNTSSVGAGGNDAFLFKYNSAGVLQWQRFLGGTGSDIAYGVAVDASGNAYITGNTNSQGAGGTDAFIAKYNPSGVIQWQRVLGGTGTEVGYGIAVSSAGSVYITGDTYSQGLGSSEILLVKYDTAGTLQWQRSLGSAQVESGKAITLDAAENVYVSGYANDAVGNERWIITKYNTSGVIQWQRSIKGKTYGCAYGITIGPDSTFIAVGNIDAFGSNALIVRLPTDGACTGYYDTYVYQPETLTDAARTLTAATATLTNNTTASIPESEASRVFEALPLPVTSIPVSYGGWVAAYGSSLSENTYFRGSGCVDTSGNIISVGYGNTGFGSSDALVCKYSPKGELVWQKSIGTSALEYGVQACTDPAGNIYVGVFTAVDSIWRPAVAKLSANGDIQWVKYVNTTGFAELFDMEVSQSGNIYLVSCLENIVGASSSKDGYLIKLDSTGAYVWGRAIGTTAAATDFLYGVITDASENVYVTGYTSSQTSGLKDLFLAKYTSAGAITWQRRLGGTSYDVGHCVGVDSALNVYVVGETGSAPTSDILVAKYDSSGTIKWQKTLGLSARDSAIGLSVLPSGDLYVVANHRPVGQTNYQCAIIKLNTLGAVVWQRLLTANDQTTSTTSSYSVAYDPTGYLCIFGGTTLIGAGSEDILVARLPDDGSGVGSYGGITYGYWNSPIVTSALTSTTTTLNSTTVTYPVADLVVSTKDPAYTSVLLQKEPESYWISVIGDSADNEIYAIDFDNEGNSYYAGYTVYNGEAHGLVGKVSKLGEPLWQKALAVPSTPSNYERFYGVAVDRTNESVYISGSVEITGYDTAFFVAKYSYSGVLQWQRTLNNTVVADNGYTVATDPSGNVYVSAATYSQGLDALVAKYNSAGTLQWQRALGGTGTESVVGVAADVSGNVYAAGSVTSQSVGGTDVLITKYNTSGTIQWQRSLGGATTDNTAINGIALDSAANIYISFTTDSQGQGLTDIGIAKYSTAGTLLWQIVLGDTGTNTAGAITVDSEGSAYITGYTPVATNVGTFIAKVSSVGTVLWQSKIYHSGLLRGQCIAIHPYNGLYICGYTSNTIGAGGTDGFIAKIPSNGSISGTYGPFTFEPASLTATSSTLTDAAKTLTGITTTLTSATSTLTENTLTFSATKFDL